MKNSRLYEINNVLIGLLFLLNYLKETRKCAIVDTEDYRIKLKNFGKALKTKSSSIWLPNMGRIGS